MKAKNHNNISTAAVKSILVGSYAWLTTLSLGLVLLDIRYAGLVPDAPAAHGEAADFLLFIKALTILTALGAIGSSMDRNTSRNYLIASLAATIMGFLIFAVLSPILQNGSSLGSFIRILLNGSVSALAFIGFYKYCSEPLIKISYV